MQAQILMSQLILWLREQFPTILQNGVEFILNFANGFFEALPSVISNIGQILNQVLTAIITAIPSVMQSGYDLIVGLAKELVGIIRSHYENHKYSSRFTPNDTRTLPWHCKKGMELVGKLAMNLEQLAPNNINSGQIVNFCNRENW